MLLGMPSDHNSMQLQVHHCDKAWVAEHVTGLDEADGFGAGGVWPVDTKGAQPAGRVSRTIGLPFPRRGNINAQHAAFIGGIPYVPVSDDAAADVWTSKRHAD